MSAEVVMRGVLRCDECFDEFDDAGDDWADGSIVDTLTVRAELHGWTTGNAGGVRWDHCPQCSDRA